MYCIQCGKEVDGKKQYCNDACKQEAYRNRNRNNSAVTGVTEPTVTEPTVTEPTVTTPDNTGQEQPEPVDCKARTVVIEQPDLSKLPMGVSIPTGRRDAATAQMSKYDIQVAISWAARDSWAASPAYCELIYRLLTWDYAELTADGYWIPAWLHVLNTAKTTG